MKRLVVLAAMFAAMMTQTGCISTYLNDESVGPDGKTTKEVTFYRGGLGTVTTVDNAEVNYQGVTARIGGYSNKGDAEFVNQIAAGVIGGMIAYKTGGASAVPAAVASAMKAYKAKAAQTNAEDAVSAPDVIETVKDSSADISPGKYGVVVLGNRKGCPLCRALWKPTFEADVEKALPDADVIDADLTDNPAFYKKYFPSEAFVYPYAIVFDAQGKRVGAFTARGVDTDGFIAKVSELCKGGGCAPAQQ